MYVCNWYWNTLVLSCLVAWPFLNQQLNSQNRQITSLNQKITFHSIQTVQTIHADNAHNTSFYIFSKVLYRGRLLERTSYWNGSRNVVVVVWHIWNCYLCIFSSEELDWGELSLEWVPREKGNSAAVLQPTPLPAGWWSWWWSWLSSWSSWWSETEWMRIIITAPSERKLWASLAQFVSAFVWTGLPKELITWHISILELFIVVQ